MIVIVALLLTVTPTTGTTSRRFRLEHSFIDVTLDGKNYAQTCVADVDRDGKPEFVLGRQYGELYWYDRDDRGNWTRYPLGGSSPSDVGACAIDVDGDGWVDVVTGGAWYRNSRAPRTKPFERIVFDPTLRAVHDVVAADLDGDGRAEVITMSDAGDLRYYKVPHDPTRPWEAHVIGPAVHAGVAVGDLDGDGDLDVVRSNVWFENVRGDGTEWAPHDIGPTGATSGWEAHATRAVCRDLNRDGKLDVVLTDCEIRGAKIWWARNVDGKGRQWKRHELPTADDAKRGAYHSLAVADFDGDGVDEIFTCEMEWVAGDRRPRFFLWHNPDGRGQQWVEHVILDANLGGHEALVADFDGDGRLDIVSKPWAPVKENGLGGKMHVDFLRNVGRH